MDRKEKDQATLTTVLQQFEHWNFNRAQEIKTRLEAGETLTDFDLEFLKRVGETAVACLPIVERNPEYQDLAAEIISFYHSITELALKNEEQFAKSGVKFPTL